ncbi:pyridoxamine 5'-phosphate oxidase family protein [uncultured Paracoccus sp.]|uniref:pyridoxamine 5'-phosphate oxidase family protein n=1 Tax=uncultured Paracoccus sp. TaxID=189685 RepID=UPI00260AAA81|nr:pyridoxamine 5'-phosphate oxidase family protein [uncultured Paracoccus sp.]
MADKATFWERLKDVNAGMLGCAPHWKLAPMSHYADPDASALWFITADGTEWVQAVSAGPQKAVHCVSSAGQHLYARIEGELSLSNDRQKLDEIWNAVASSWFEDGKRDEDVRLLKLSMTGAEVWATTGSAGFLYEIAKAKLTGAKPDMGEHFVLAF